MIMITRDQVVSVEMIYCWYRFENSSYVTNWTTDSVEARGTTKLFVNFLLLLQNTSLLELVLDG